MSDGYTILSLDEAQTGTHRDCTLIPVRQLLDFRAAGVNAWKGDGGDDLVPPHSEDPGMEELYVVVRGSATFTVDEETATARSGTLIFVPPGVHRRAVASEDGTIVLVVGGTVGSAFRSTGWDSVDAE